MTSPQTTDRLFYAFTLFYNMDIQRGLFILFLLQAGITQGEVGLLQFILFLTSLLLEVPSGILADKYGRKATLLTGMIALVINGIGMLLFDNFLPFAILFALYGTSVALTSGADRALLYDNLMAQHRQNEFSKIISRSRAIAEISLGAAILAGGLIQDTFGWDFVYITFAVCKLFGAFVVVFMPELQPEIETEKQNTPPAESQNISTQAYAFFTSKSGLCLLPLFIGFSLMQAGIGPLFIFAQDYLRTLDISIPFITMTYTAINGLTAFLFLYADRVNDRFSLFTIALWTTILLCLGLWGMTQLTNNIIIVGVMITILSITAFYETAYDTYINNHIKSSIRATCLSMAGLIESSFLAISFALFGYMVELYNYNTAFIVLSALCAMGMIGVIITIRLNPSK